jgi:dTDP-3-amino-3,4,6-trideoxy-alpha-D-glucose transaminase
MRRRNVASTYLNSLTGLQDLVLPSVHGSTEPIWHIFPVRHKKRDELQSFLKNRGVDTLIHYPVPPHLSGAYADLNMPIGTFPIAERIASSELSLPMGPHLSLDDAEYVANIIREYISQS